MNKKKAALLGYSKHAIVVAETLQQSGYTVIGYFEKQITEKNPLSLKYLGYEKDDNFHVIARNLYLFPAIGDNRTREIMMEFLSQNNFHIASAISPRAYISPNCTIGKGTLICQGACINPLVDIGKGVIINTGAIVEHNSTVSDFAHVAPGAVLTGDVRIGEGTFVGANAVVKQGISIGRNVIIGVGAVILSNVPDNETWVGNPAKKIKK